MSLWAIVPVKPLRRGKSRLAEALSDKDRAELNQKLLVHTVQTLMKISELENILVVSRDTEALAIARTYGARTVGESGAPHLNVALTRATAVAKTYNASGVLVLPADLPQISPEDIREMIEASKDAPVMVIAPDHAKLGTNGLLVNPAGVIEYEFGENSFEKHVAQAEEKGIAVRVCMLPSLARDIDEPDDLAFLDAQPEYWAFNGGNGKNERGSNPAV